MPIRADVYLGAGPFLLRPNYYACYRREYPDARGVGVGFRFKVMLHVPARFKGIGIIVAFGRAELGDAADLRQIDVIGFQDLWQLLIAFNR